MFSFGPRVIRRVALVSAGAVTLTAKFALVSAEQRTTVETEQDTLRRVLKEHLKVEKRLVVLSLLAPQ